MKALRGADFTYLLLESWNHRMTESWNGHAGNSIPRKTTFCGVYNNPCLFVGNWKFCCLVRLFNTTWQLILVMEFSICMSQPLKLIFLILVFLFYFFISVLNLYFRNSTTYMKIACSTYPHKISHSAIIQSISEFCWGILPVRWHIYDGLNVNKHLPCLNRKTNIN